jgi:5'-nucleotidase
VAKLTDVRQQMMRSDEKKIEETKPAGIEASDEPVALFDLDGTLADFDGAMQKGMSELAGPGEAPWEAGREDDEPSYLTARRRLLKQRPGFWRGLKEFPDGFALLDMAVVVGYRIMILSRGPSANSAAWAEKLDWVQRHVISSGRAPGCEITLTMDKSLTYGRVLVDDWPEYILSWLRWRERGLVIMPSRPWNKTFAHPQVIPYLHSEASENRVRSSLVRHRDRKAGERGD